MSDVSAILSIDHGAHDLVPMAEAAGAEPARIPHFKRLAAEAAIEVARTARGVGMFLDGELGAEALEIAAAADLWVARQYPHGSQAAVAEWPRAQIVKLIANARTDARTPYASRRPEVRSVAAGCLREGRPTVVEALASAPATTASLMAQLYGDGVRPTWWLIEPQPSATAWREAAEAIDRHDPDCRGFIVIARNEAPRDDFALARRQPEVRAFVGGRSIFGAPFRQWLAGETGDADAVSILADRFRAMVSLWHAAATGDK